ncbi:MAG: peptide deformylase [Anaerolineaceae bacterium]|jgi:peptide deformylase
MIQKILLLGDPLLYKKSEPVEESELSYIAATVTDLHDTLMDHRRRKGFGRGIAAPQIGVLKRLIYLYIDRPVLIINPELTFSSRDVIAIWDDCMSVPGLWVQVDRYMRCHLEYKDLNWKQQSLSMEGTLAELIQHEYDHLDGILMTMRARDRFSFSMIKPPVMKSHV